MSTVFTKIINGEIPCYKIAEDDRFFAFLDISPRQQGHTLVIPKKEINYIFDIDDQLLSEYILFAKRVANAIQKSISCSRVALSVIGLEVPHAHIHLIPIQSEKDLSAKKTKYSSEEMAIIAKKISSNFQ